jgi:hypothetical protein
MGAREEISKVDKFTMVLILDVDYAPFVLSAPYLLAVDDDRLLTADDSEWDDVLNGGIGSALFVVQLLIVIWVHLEVVECEFLLNSLLERSALFECEGIGLRDDWNNIDHIGELLQDHNVNGFEGVAGGLDEEEAAVDAGIGNVAFSLRREFFSQVRRVLVFDVLDDWIPAWSRSVLRYVNWTGVEPTIDHCSPDHHIQGYRQC